MPRPIRKINRWTPGPAAKHGRTACWSILILVALASYVHKRSGGQALHNSGLGFAVGRFGKTQAPFNASQTINLEALDGTGGRQGPRRWDDEEGGVRPGAFASHRSYLSRAEATTYEQWLAWSDKPRGLDYVLPSREYFSLGKLRSFKGNIAAPGAMQAMLEARSYKKEIIHFCIAGGGTWRMGLNFIFNLRDLGYEHWVVYVPREKQCNELEAALAGFGTIGCIWTTMFDAPDAPAPLRQDPNGIPLKQVTWVVRWVHVLRIIRLGYNVFNIDTDMVLHDDMYKYLKGPLLGNLTWICGDEDTRDACNGGTNYLQNVAPNGPAAWTAGAMVDRMLRIAEDVDYWRPNPWSEPLRDWAAAVDDQGQLNSAIKSATTGLYVLPQLFPGMDDEAIWDAVRQHPWSFFEQDSSLAIPDFWRERFHVDKVDMKWHVLEVPHKQLTPIFNNSRGPFASHFWREVAAESGPITWFDITSELAKPHKVGESDEEGDRDSSSSRPDPWADFTAAGASGAADAIKADAPGAAVKEYIGKTMDYTIDTWHSGRQHEEVCHNTGYNCGKWWGVKPPRVVVGHTVLIPAAFLRIMFFKITGWFHWKVEQLMADHMGAPGFYPVSTPEAPHPQLLLFAPSANFDTMGSAQLADIGFDLLTAAVVSGRKAVWPLINCNTSWLVHSEDAVDHGPNSDMRGCHLPRDCNCSVHNHWFGTPWHYMPVVPVIDDNYPRERKYCIHFRDYNDPMCQQETLMYPDFKHMLRHLPAAAATPSQDNTLFFEALGRPGDLPTQELSADALQERLDKVAAQPVVYLGAVSRVTAGAVPPEKRSHFNQLQRGCRPMWRLPEDRLHERLKPLLGDA